MDKCLDMYKHIDEELSDAWKYAMHAAEEKGKNSALCILFSTLAQEELSHASKIRSAVLNMRGDEPSEVLDYLDSSMVDKAAKVKLILG